MTPAPGMNPISMLETAGEVAGPLIDAPLTGPLEILVLLTVLSVAPALLVMCTCFPRLLIVFGLLRQALGTQTLPPSQVVTALSLLLTFIVMAPTWERIHAEAIAPYQAGDPEVPNQVEVWNRARVPIRDFMFRQIEAHDNWDTLYTMLEHRGVDTSDPASLTRGDVDMLALVPAYMLSELEVAFAIGFRIYLPFLVIDLVISSLLISMGMLMLPPILISLPFKLLLFVISDGWHLVAGSLLAGIA